tara:strand:+ start:314 stop:1129 length:816 start_codon:yes stop_codon:yes gene_type:complete
MKNKISKIIIAIPARLESKRLPNKVIKEIGNKLMIERVLTQCRNVQDICEIVLCTDSEKLIGISEKLGFKSIKTIKNCNSGTERIASVIYKIMDLVWGENSLKWDKALAKKKFEESLIINVQADQPFIDPKIISQLIAEFKKSKKDTKVITPIYKLNSKKIDDPNKIKVILNKYQNAIYFSRSAIPYIRDKNECDWERSSIFWGHVGVYGYRADVLKLWGQMLISENEVMEGLEQLRLINEGITIKTFKINSDVLSVDTIENLLEARSKIK